MSIFDESGAYKPFKYPWAVELAILHEDIHWTEKEVTNIQDDLRDWNTGKLSQRDKAFNKLLLNMFTQADVAVEGNYIKKLMPYVGNNEISNLMSSFTAREAIHQRAYALVNETLQLSDEEFAAFRKFAEMNKLWEFMTKDSPYLHPDFWQERFAWNIARQCVCEGVVLFVLFACLLNFVRAENGGTMKGQSQVVAWSIRDENVHVDGNSQIFRAVCDENKKMVNDDFKKSVYQIFRDSIDCLDNFLDLIFAEGDLPNFKKDEAKLFARYLADRRLIQLGFKGNWKIKTNTLKWFEEMTADSQENFFEVPVTEYSKNNLSGKWLPDDAYKNYLRA